MPTISRQVSPMSATKSRLRGRVDVSGLRCGVVSIGFQHCSRSDAVAGKKISGTQAFLPFQLQLVNDYAAPSAGNLQPAAVGPQHGAGKAFSAGDGSGKDLEQPAIEAGYTLRARG